MSRKKVLSNVYKQSGLGWGSWIALGLLLDRLSAPGWLWGVAISLAFLWHVAVIVEWFTTDACEPVWKDCK